MKYFKRMSSEEEGTRRRMREYREEVKKEEMISTCEIGEVLRSDWPSHIRSEKEVKRM